MVARINAQEIHPGRKFGRIQIEFKLVGAGGIAEFLRTKQVIQVYGSRALIGRCGQLDVEEVGERVRGNTQR